MASGKKRGMPNVQKSGESASRPSNGVDATGDAKKSLASRLHWAVSFGLADWTQVYFPKSIAYEAHKWD